MKPAEDKKPHLIITVGAPGSGKSFFAEHFADIFKAPIISIDRLRKQIFPSPTFSKEEDETLEKVADDTLDEVLKTKRTVIYEGKTGLRNDRLAISRKARHAGYEPLFVWVQTDRETAKKRATKASNGYQPLTEEQFDIRFKQFSVPHKLERVIVISGKHTFASQLRIVLRHLIEPRNVINANETSTSNATPPQVTRNYLIR